MPFDFATAKALARRTVHKTFGVQAFYQDDSMDLPVELRARWHNKSTQLLGELDNQGYSQIIEGIDRIIFNVELIDDTQEYSVFTQDGQPITLQRAGEITFPMLLDGATFILENKIPADGPTEERWMVSRK